MAFERIDTQVASAASQQQSRKFRTQLRPLAHLVALACAGGLASGAWAQQAAQSVEVTGTLIRGAIPVGAPVTKLDRDVIDKSGVSNTTDLLRLMPQIPNLGADEGHFNTAQNANQNVSAGSGINLRGLGPESTLTMVSGHRLAPGGLAAQYTDPAAIPPIAIDRIEVITDGGSATYGSDAVGGVVNIRLRKRFEGVEVSARGGMARDVHQNEVGLLAGHAWDGGSAMVAIDNNKRGNLQAEKRAFYTDDLRAWGGPDLRLFNSSPGNIQVGATRYAIPAGQNGVGLTAAKLVAGNPNLQSIYRGVDALPAQDRMSFVAAAEQQISEAVRVNLEAFWSERNYVRHLASPTANATVRSANPFFVSPVAGATSAVVNYSFINDFGNVIADGFERTHRVMAGVDFDVTSTWSGNAFVAQSGTREKNYGLALNTNAMNAALADTNPATALNLFCDGNKFTCNNPATLAKMRGAFDRNTNYRMLDGGVKFDGPLYTLPAGKVRLAIGAEAHTEAMNYFEERNTATPNAQTFVHLDNANTKPSRTVKSVYAEAQVPLVGGPNAMTGVQRLDLSLAVRADDYSDFGRTTNPKLGVDWVPVEGLKFYTTWSTAFRAPTLGDIDPVNAGVINVVDRIGADGKTNVHGLQLLGGREGLKPETATIATFGAAFKPAILPGLTLSADYYNVRYEDRILTPGNDATILQRPELAPYLTLNPAAADVIALMQKSTYTGSATEPVAGIKFIADGRRYNAGKVETSGVDVTARYDWATALGRINVGGTANYIFNYRQQFTPTTALVGGLINTLNNPLRLRARGELGWTGADARVTAFANFTNSYRNTTLASAPDVASYTTIDLTGSYDIGKLIGGHLRDLRMSVSVQNLFDRDPPYVQNGSLAFDPQNTSALGRFMSVSLSTRF